MKNFVKQHPLGVKYFELEDLGIEVDDHERGVQVIRLDPNSPLAKHGIRLGDVITRLNDTPAETFDEFRRELRRSVIWETGIFWLLRDGQRFTRVVPLADAVP